MASLFSDIVGRDRGINVAADVLTRTVDGVDLNAIWAEFQTSLSILNAGREPLVALFSFDTTNASDAMPLDGTTVSFEKASEFGVPQSARVQPRHFVAGYPLEWYDLATRFTKRFLRDASREQVDTQHAGALEASNRLQFKFAMEALLTPQRSSSRLVNENDTPIYSLYAGSADDAPPSFAGRTFTGGHDHYLVSGANIIDGQDLEDLVAHITHHGFGIGPSEKIVLLVNPVQGKTVRGFRAGVSNSPYDFIPSETAPAYLSTEVIVGDKPPAQFNGLDVIGSFGRALVVESYYAPSGYVIASAVAGPNSPRNALAVRSHVRPELKGLQILRGESSPTFPLIDSGYQIGVGFGVRNRGAAAVMQIKASGAYETPVVPA